MRQVTSWVMTVPRKSLSNLFYLMVRTRALYNTLFHLFQPCLFTLFHKRRTKLDTKDIWTSSRKMKRRNKRDKKTCSRNTPTNMNGLMSLRTICPSLQRSTCLWTSPSSIGQETLLCTSLMENSVLQNCTFTRCLTTKHTPLVSQVKLKVRNSRLLQLLKGLSGICQILNSY